MVGRLPLSLPVRSLPATLSPATFPVTGKSPEFLFPVFSGVLPLTQAP